ncbi:hypothetical protein T4B_9375 [Trichinella pseudospiralis]|uniref:Uncharacterized protein n=1 Tax=Trichinella pseudospiralis TaxID=6337 RepID=A0A0V1JNH7_TRIPS|nr:hypothetical protein T4B_9375 [Trichinella pseudospiralis]KRZ36537.1 hypothetical protein T4C_1579 [Trichinella pseudospiralis]
MPRWTTSFEWNESLIRSHVSTTIAHHWQTCHPMRSSQMVIKPYYSGNTLNIVQRHNAGGCLLLLHETYIHQNDESESKVETSHLLFSNIRNIKQGINGLGHHDPKHERCNRNHDSKNGQPEQ